MSLLEKIKALWSIKKAVSKIEEAYKMDTTPIKPGWKTSEFWLTVIFNLVTILGTLKGVIPANIGTVALTVLNSVYGLIRAITKSNAPDLPTVDSSTTTVINK